MLVFQLNLRRGHKFIFSVLLFGFSMARISALVMRLVWSTHPTDASIAIAANVFNAAGVLLLFLVNLMFAQRVLRAYHPAVGWQQPVRWAFRALYGSVVALLIMVVTASVYLVFTLDPVARGQVRNVQLFAGVYLAVLAFLPIPIVLVSRLAASGWRLRGRRAAAAANNTADEEANSNDDGEKSHQNTRKNAGLVKDKFGSGRFRVKIALLLTSSALLSLGAAFRAGIAFVPRPITDPAWYHHRAAYYCFNYVLELIVVYMYGIARFDRRFHVPNGSSGPGDYSKGLGLSVNREEEVFGPGSSGGDGDGNDTRGESPDSAPADSEWEEQYAYARRRSEAIESAKKSTDAA